MTNPPDAPPDDGGAPPVPPPDSDVAMAVTPSRKKKAEPKGPVLIEKTVKFRFTRVNQHDAIDPTTIHLHWVQIVQEALKDEVQVFTNNGGIMPMIDTMRWTSVQHGQQYKVHFQQPKNSGYNRDHSSSNTATRSPAAFIMHRIRSTSSITSIRNMPRIQKLLRDNGVYFTEHRWPEDICEISQQGFMLGIDPQFYSPTQAHERISIALKTALKSSNSLMHIPKFTVAFCTPQINFNAMTFKTKAYAIETEKRKAVDMQRVLKEACKKTNDFVPFHLRSKHPEAFSRYIQQHTKILSQNHTIVLNYIGNQSILYLEERIRAVPGVIDLVACQSVETDGKFRVQVNKDDFYKVRSHLSKRVPEWYNEFVPEDAKKEMMRKYNYTPEVAPLMSDGYSSGSDGYMTASINTALSYASTVSQLTTESQQRQQPKANRTPTTPKTAWNTPPPTMIQAQEADAGLVSELKSSKSEVEALKTQMSKMEEEKNSQIQQIEQKAEQQRQESEQRAEEQRIQMEKQAEAQRNEFTQQLEDQRKALEAESTRRQQEMEARFQAQLNQAIQTHFPTPAASTPPRPSPEEVARRMEIQDTRIQQLTDMLHQLLTKSPSEVPVQSARPSTGKRQASQTVVDLTMDHCDPENTSQQSDIRRSDQGVKKRDTKDTPRQNLAGNISIKMEIIDSPTTSELSMSMMEPTASQHPGALPWEAGLHPPSEVYSPPAPPRTYRMGLGNSSPMSNLALHPRFRSPSHEFPTDHSTQSVDTLPNQPSTQSFGESNISEAHMRDINAQHAGLQGFNIHQGNADSPQEKEQNSAKGPDEGDQGAHQATPADGSPSASHHEI